MKAHETAELLSKSEHFLEARRHWEIAIANATSHECVASYKLRMAQDMLKYGDHRAAAEHAVSCLDVDCSDCIKMSAIYAHAQAWVGMCKPRKAVDILNNGIKRYNGSRHQDVLDLMKQLMVRLERKRFRKVKPAPMKNRIILHARCTEADFDIAYEAAKKFNMSLSKFVRTAVKEKCESV